MVSFCVLVRDDLSFPFGQLSHRVSERPLRMHIVGAGSDQGQEIIETVCKRRRERERAERESVLAWVGAVDGDSFGERPGCVSAGGCV